MHRAATKRISGEAFAGLLLVTMMSLTVLHAFYSAFPGWWGGLLGWAAGVLLWRRLAPRQSIQVLLFSGIGLLGLFWQDLKNIPDGLLRALSDNNLIISMLIGVSFLRLVSALAFYTHGEHLPKGKKAFWLTMLGVHLFGSVINMSAVMIIADRLTRRDHLQKQQAIVLSRSFSSAAFWSPFFAAMAAALTFAPGANIPVLVITGLGLAAISLLVTGYQLGARKKEAIAAFVGYPMHFETLWIPGILAVSVLVIHLFFPRWPILSIVTLLAPVLSIAILLTKSRGAVVMRDISAHVRTRLPEMANEVLLFLAAGLLASGLESFLLNSGHGFSFASLGIKAFGIMEAAVTLACIIALSGIGIHPVIGIAVFAALFAPLHPEPNLLAMTFLVAWGLGVCISPVSGLHLALQGRYRIDGWRFLPWNFSYALAMFIVALAPIAMLYRLFSK